MHVFADASKEAYAVVCFGRFVLKNENVFVRFLFGKSKACPVSGSVTIPHLELVAAAFATRVAKPLMQESGMKFNSVVYWSDSLATLHLINNTTRQFNIFC